MHYFSLGKHMFTQTVILLATILLALFSFSFNAYSQEGDFFGGINIDSGGYEEEAQQSQDQMKLYPLKLSIVSHYPSDHDPNAKIIHTAPMRDGVRIERGSVLKLDYGFKRSVGSNTYRRVLLWSKLSEPYQNLHADTLYNLEIFPEDGDELVWEKSKQPAWPSFANLKKKDRLSSKNLGGNQYGHKGGVIIPTAILKTGDYQFWVKVYRKEDGKTVESYIENFNFKLVDAPLHLVANLPTSTPTYDENKSAFNIRHTINVSDWAVPPVKAQLRTNIPGIELNEIDAQTGQIEDDTFDILFMSGKKYAGRKANISISIKDGLGRTASLKRTVQITGGSSGEIRVSMASSVKAGRTITGTITYPRGYKLLKEPFIGDRRGFEWTSSDYTSFRIKVKEEGVHYKRLFAVIAKGRVKGLDYEPVLTWKRTYNIESQNLIYDEERNRRRTEANNKVWNDAFSAFASGVGAAASAYAEASADIGEKIPRYEMTDEDGNVLYTGDTPPDIGKASSDSVGYSDQEISEIWERANAAPAGTINSGGHAQSSASRSSSSGDGTYCSKSYNKRAPRCARPAGVSGQLDFSNGEPKNICGVDTTTGEWKAIEWDSMLYSDKFGLEVGVPGSGQYNQLHTIKLTKRKPVSGTTKHASLSFYAKNCVLDYEYIPKLDGYEVHSNWDNGGKKKVEILGRYTKEWDRAGNLIEYFPVGAADKDICSNSNSKYRNCS